MCSVIPLTLFTIMPLRLCAMKMIGRLLFCVDGSPAQPYPVSYLSQTSVICRSRQRSDTSIHVWSNRYSQLTGDPLCVFAS